MKTKRVSVDFVAPPTVMVELGGEDGKVAGNVVITPLKVGEFPAVIAVLQFIFGLLTGIPGGAAAFDKSAPAEVREMAALYLSTLFTERGNSERLLDLLALLIRSDRTWVDGLYANQAAVLLIEAIEVNVDFFTRSMPLIKKVLEGKSFGKVLGIKAADEASAPSPTGLTPSNS